MMTRRLRTPWLLVVGVALLILGAWALQQTLRGRPSPQRRPQRLGAAALVWPVVVPVVPGLTA